MPLGPDEEPTIETVRKCMGFVDGIGGQLKDICEQLDNFENLRNTVSIKHTAGLRLELGSGSPRICVDSTIWDVGFGLEDLFSHLTS